MAVRQQDIADHLGISICTVSLALRNAPKVAKSTREQVLAAAEQLGYFQRQRATAAEIHQVAFVTIFELTDLFYASVLNGAADECHNHGIALRYSPIPKPKDRKGSIGSLVARYGEADALLLVGPIDEETVQHFYGLGRPIVLVDNTVVELPIDRILVENSTSIRRIVSQLVRWGHQRIAYIQGPENTTSFRERLSGYRMAIQEYRLEPVELYTDDASIAYAEHNIGRWLNTHGRPDFTAVVCCNDEVAIGTIHALEARGLRVPHDISVIGFDDIDMAKIIRPALTTCHVDRDLLGRLGVRQLLERIRQPKARSRAIVLDTEFVERASAQPRSL
jgi:DNA-binding LacI/PurR family transcriptional regulator